MRELYSKATCVLVWLGNNKDKEAEQVFNGVAKIALPRNNFPSLEELWWNYLLNRSFQFVEEEYFHEIILTGNRRLYH